MTVDISEPGSDKKPGNRRTLSESDVRFGQGQVSQSRIEFAPNISSSMTGVFSQFFFLNLMLVRSKFGKKVGTFLLILYGMVQRKVIQVVSE